MKIFNVIAVVVAASEIQDGGNWSGRHMMREDSKRRLECQEKHSALF